MEKSMNTYKAFRKEHTMASYHDKDANIMINQFMQANAS
jgi:hypothetical protein